MFSELLNSQHMTDIFGEITEIEIKSLVKNALTDEIDNRGIYMKGIDNSYYYEGYNLYLTETI